MMVGARNGAKPGTEDPDSGSVHPGSPKDFLPPRQRLVSECSSDGGFENLRPLELDDLTSYQNKNRYVQHTKYP